MLVHIFYLIFVGLTETLIFKVQLANKSGPMEIRVENLAFIRIYLH